jgi:pseudaminic acid biosynthesis-associated methylase
LEVGCNIGANLECLQELVPDRNIWGIEVNERALQQLRSRLPGVNALWGVGRDLPFRDCRFDLYFTMGVLIHQPAESLLTVMSEVVRCSRRWVLCAEYFAEDTVEVPYRGPSGALFKRDYGRIYRERFPHLRERKRGFLGRDAGFDDVTFWVFEKADNPDRLP